MSCSVPASSSLPFSMGAVMNFLRAELRDGSGRVAIGLSKRWLRSVFATFLRSVALLSCVSRHHCSCWARRIPRFCCGVGFQACCRLRLLHLGAENLGNIAGAYCSFRLNLSLVEQHEGAKTASAGLPRPVCSRGESCVPRCATSAPVLVTMSQHIMSLYSLQDPFTRAKLRIVAATVVLRRWHCRRAIHL